MQALLAILPEGSNDGSTLLLMLLVFLAAGMLAFALMAVVRVRGEVKRRTARIMDDERQGNVKRSLRYSSLQAATRLLEYTTKHYASTNDANTRVLRQRLIPPATYAPRRVASFLIA